MSFILTYSCTCDACGDMILNKTIVPTGNEIIKREDTILNMDLCFACKELASGAVAEVLNPIITARQLRRSN